MGSKLDRVAWPVRTPRLSLRRAAPLDIERTWEYRRLPEVSYWLRTTPRSLEEYRAKFDGTDRLARTLVAELAGEVIGDLMLKVRDGWAQNAMEDQAKDLEAQLGWCFNPRYGGSGYATEAVEASIDLCFQTLGLRRVTATCFAGNTPSWRLMERLGMRCEVRTVGDSLHLSGAWLDGLGYALLADEWRHGREKRVADRARDYRASET